MAATALWDETTAAGLLLFSVPGGAGTELNWCLTKLCCCPTCASLVATSVGARRVLLLDRTRVWMLLQGVCRCHGTLRLMHVVAMHNHHKPDQHLCSFSCPSATEQSNMLSHDEDSNTVVRQTMYSHTCQQAGFGMPQSRMDIVDMYCLRSRSAWLQVQMQHSIYWQMPADGSRLCNWLLPAWLPIAASLHSYWYTHIVSLFCHQHACSRLNQILWQCISRRG